jgi:uncharacterized membrane protein HdeD (DUF308 family)
MKTEHEHIVVDKKSPTWVWALQIGIAAVAIGLSISSIIYPVYAVMAAFTAAAIILLLFGIEHVVTGVFVKGSRFVHIGLGGLIIILSSIVIAYPTASATLIVWLAAIALLFSGVASIISGLRVRHVENRRVPGRASRAVSVAAGGLAVAISVSIMASPTFGVQLAGFVIGIALLVYGIRLFITGVSGLRHATATPATASSSDTMAA